MNILTLAAGAALSFSVTPAKPDCSVVVMDFHVKRSHFLYFIVDPTKS